MKIYEGTCIDGGNLVAARDTDGNAWALEHRVHHSPTGMGWGYVGSGPADLARSILWDYLGKEPQPACYQAFKFAFVAGWPADQPWKITGEEIDDWLEMWSATEMAGGGTGLATVDGYNALADGISMEEAAAIDRGERPSRDDHQ